MQHATTQNAMNPVEGGRVPAGPTADLQYSRAVLTRYPVEDNIGADFCPHGTLLQTTCHRFILLLHILTFLCMYS